MLSYQRMGWRQRGAVGAGFDDARARGRREMQTFRKLPKSRPRRKAGSSKANGDGMR